MLESVKRYFDDPIVTSNSASVQKLDVTDMLKIDKEMQTLSLSHTLFIVSVKEE